MPGWGIALIITAIMLAVLAVLYFVGRRTQKKQAEQQEQIEAAKQTINILVISKKKLKLRDAGLPQAVLESTARWMRGRKVPVIQAKVGPKVMNFLAEPKVYDMVPLKKEVRADISGLYIINVRGLHGNVITPPAKKSFATKINDKMKSMSASLNEGSDKGKKKK